MPDQAVHQDEEAGGEGSEDHRGQRPGRHLQEPQREQGRRLRDIHQGPVTRNNLDNISYSFLQICENCEVDFCSGACALFDYEDHMVCALQIILILAPFFLLQRKPQEEVEEGANEKQPKSKSKKKSSKKKKSTAVTK